MDSNHSFMQRIVDYQQSAVPQRYGSEHMIPTSTTTPYNLLSNTLNTGNSEMAGPPPSYPQHIARWPPSQVQIETLHLLCEARNEIIDHIYTKSPQQLSPLLDKFKKRRELQQFLASKCTDPAMYKFITSNEFLVRPDIQRFYDVIEKLTGLDVSKFQKAQTHAASSNPLPHHVHQGQQNENRCSTQYVNYLHNQIAPTPGNFNPFQVERSATSVYNIGENLSPVTSFPSCPSQGSLDSFTQETNVPNNSGSVSGQDVTIYDNSQQSCWYSRPAETYENGRAVQLKEKEQHQQFKPVQAHILVHCDAESVHQKGLQTVSQPSVQNNGNWKETGPVPEVTDNILTSISPRNSSQLCVIEASNVGVIPQQKISASFKNDENSGVVIVSDSEDDLLDTKESEQLSQLCVKNKNHNTTCQSISSAKSQASLPKCEETEIGDKETVGNLQETNSSVHGLQDGESLLDDQTGKLYGKETQNAKSPQAGVSLGEYDPPLPVIRHKKREHRISPRKIKDLTEHKMVNVGKSDSYNSKAVLSKEKNEKVSREPLFSVLDNMVSPSDHSDKCKVSGVCLQQELKVKLNYKPRSKIKDHEHSSKSKASNIHVQKPKSHQKSSGEEKHKKHSDKRQRRDDNRSDSNKEKEKISDKTDRVGKFVHNTHKSSTCLSGRDKVTLGWAEKSKENGKYQNNVFKLHRRGKSFPDGKGYHSKQRKEQRSNTWDSSGTLNIKTAEEMKETNKKGASITPVQEFVWLHGQKLLLVSIPKGQFIVMKEFLATSLQDYDSTEVYRKKTSELNINNTPLTHSSRKEVHIYLNSRNISCPSQIDIVSLTDAQKLLHHVTGNGYCNRETCVSREPPTVQSPVAAPKPDSEVKRSDSPDSTVQGNKKSPALSVSRKRSVENNCDNVQHNNVSSQSLEDDLEDSSSFASDTTYIYCDGKPCPFQNSSENDNVIDADGSKDSVQIDFDGGVAVVFSENSDNRFLRFVNIHEHKYYLYQDLFELFGKNEVIKIVLNDSMHVERCTPEGADYLNRNQRDMIPVNSDCNSLILEKYVRKIFAYFGESYPRRNLPINANLLEYKKSSLKRSDEENEPPAKKSRQDETMTNKPLCKTTGSSKLKGHEKGAHKSKVRDYSMEVFSSLKSQHLELAAELSALKMELKESKNRSKSLEKKCMLYEADITNMKTELKESAVKKSELEQRCRKQDETLSQMRNDLDKRKEDIKILQKERDHYKDFLERITDTYKVADDNGEEMGICDDQVFCIQDPACFHVGVEEIMGELKNKDWPRA